MTETQLFSMFFFSEKCWDSVVFALFFLSYVVENTSAPNFLKQMKERNVHPWGSAVIEDST